MFQNGYILPHIKKCIRKFGQTKGENPRDLSSAWSLFRVVSLWQGSGLFCTVYELIKATYKLMRCTS